MRKVVLSISALKAMNFLFETVIAPKHSIIPVQNAMYGMQVLRTRPVVDVVIVDLDYDTQENVEFINHIKTSRLYSGCKVIALSSMRESALSEFENNNVIDRVFSKPFSPEILLEFINCLSKQTLALT
jgi:two-component SAPR family response regulator